MRRYAGSEALVESGSNGDDGRDEGGNLPDGFERLGLRNVDDRQEYMTMLDVAGQSGTVGSQDLQFVQSAAGVYSQQSGTDGIFAGSLK